MRKITTSMLGLAAVLTLATPASATDSDALCSLYSKTGGSVVEFMLPLTMQQFVDMMAGKNPGLMNQMTQALVSEFDEADLIALASVDQQKAQVIGEAAGQVAIELLMSGQATSKAEIVNAMSTSCKAVGPDVIIANQMRANAAVDANMGK